MCIRDRMYSALSDGLNMSDVYDTLREGIKLFESENYLESVEVLTRARDMIEEQRAQAAMKQSIQTTLGEQLTRFVSSQWPLIIIFIFAAGTSFIAIHISREKARLKGILNGMREERESIRRVIARVQHRYFRVNSMGKMDYETTIEKYRKRLIMLEKDIYTLEQRLEI